MEIIAEQMAIEDIDSINEKLQARLEDAGIDEAEVLNKAREDLVLWDGYFGENITRGKDDMNFLLRDQWSAVERSEFSRLFKPAMTFNKSYDTVKKVIGEQRKNKPDLMVRSLTGKANQKQIDLRADLVRTISYKSQNDLVYQTGFKSSMMMGFGAWEVVLDYENPRSFNQDIRLELIPDATRVSFDPTALKPHKGDGNFCSRQYVYTKEEFYATFPWVMNPVSYSDPRSLLDFQWETRDTIVVCKYTRKEWYPVKLFLLSDGTAVTEYEWEEMQKEIELRKQLADGSQVVGNIIRKTIPEIVGERMSKDYTIRQYMLTQNQIIEFTDWPSKYLPIIFVDGDSNFINGQQYTRSFIHEAKDAQKFINYVGSEIAAEIKNRRREQWMGTPDNIQGNEQMWRNPELQSGILIAKPDQKTGAMPQKMPPWELSQTLLQQYQRGSQDIREILGFSETEQLQGRDISGKARRERKMEGSMSSFVWVDNCNQAIEQTGRVILDLLPVIVGENERHMIVSKADGRTESIILNKIVGEDENGEKIRENVLEAGDYDIEIDTGPSFAVQKDIALEFFQQTLQANPQTFPLIADLWAKNLDVQYMPQIAERFKTLVPPQIIAQEEGKQLPPQPPSPQEQMMQAQMQQQQQQMAMNAQKMKIEEQQLLERAEELRIRKEKHILEQAEMILKAKQTNDKMTLEKQKMGLEHGRLLLDEERADNDFSANLARVLSEIHRHTSPVQSE
ncbi:TPA: portal protein [Legionella anisa]|uniref:portal protein n=1 Tax=Legionella anisa TaxID=28082 RepID=UPI002244DD90|nr:portal protein [Legionella anisa]MCW8425626.1 portal protein [Legionella anisa]MCW8448945.1 portal protein [Legionella anisa]